MNKELLQQVLDTILRIDPDNLNYVYQVQKIAKEALAQPVQPKELS